MTFPRRTGQQTVPGEQEGHREASANPSGLAGPRCRRPTDWCPLALTSRIRLATRRRKRTLLPTTSLSRPTPHPHTSTGYLTSANRGEIIVDKH